MGEIEHRRSGKDAMRVEFRLDAEAGSGTFDGYLNLWNTRDSYDTEWHPGAWSRAGLEAGYPLQDMHAVNSYTRDTLGMFSAAEDGRGLVIQRGAFAPTQAGQDARALSHLAAEFGQAAELSVGFRRLLTADQDEEVRIDDPNVFTKTELKEASLIVPHFASQPGAVLTSVRMQAEALRAVTDSEDLLDPRTEGRIIDMMTEANGRKRNLVIRVGWEAAEERSEAEEPPTDEEVAAFGDLTDESLELSELPELRLDNEAGDGQAKNLKNYWTKGPGLAKWADKPHPWTALYNHLKKYIKNPEEAKATAAKWYHDVKGTWPGSKGKRSVSVTTLGQIVSPYVDYIPTSTDPIIYTRDGGEVHEDSVAITDASRPLTVANPGEAPAADDPGPTATPFLSTGDPLGEAVAEGVGEAVPVELDPEPVDDARMRAARMKLRLATVRK